MARPIAGDVFATAWVLFTLFAVAAIAFTALLSRDDHSDLPGTGEDDTTTYDRAA